MRFALTQWHKTFGIAVLVLATLRLLWRFTHRPPPAPDTISRRQTLAAHGAHLALYALMIAIPLTGWALVSVSPLDVETYLFDVIPWPHLPVAESLRTEGNEHLVERWHEIAANLVIVLLLAHVGAALKHHFVDRDATLARTLPDGSRSWNAKLAAFGVAVAASGTALYLWADAGDEATLLAAGAGEVGFVAGVTGEPTPGTFGSARSSRRSPRPTRRRAR